jgi:hypothetical protein
MTRFILAAALVAVIASRSDAQPTPIAPPTPAATPAPIVIPVPVVKPPEGYYKSGNVLVGADGYYPFDTGRYLLGGFDGLARYHGTYYMVSPGAATAQQTPAQSVVEPSPSYASPVNGHRGRFFHRR